MARPKKIDSQQLVRLLEEYFATDAAGDPSQLKFSQLERFAKSRGIEVKAYDFKRDEAVRSRMEELKRLPIQPVVSAAAIAYKNLDVTEMLRRCPDLETLKRSLTQMDAYWKKVYESTAALLRTNRELLSERREWEENSQNLNNRISDLEQQVDELSGENASLRRENTYLRKQLRLYLYPALADELLHEENLPVQSNSSVKSSAFSALIEGKTPMPFPNVQQQLNNKPKSRETRLLEQLKAMAEGNEDDG